MLEPFGKYRCRRSNHFHGHPILMKHFSFIFTTTWLLIAALNSPSAISQTTTTEETACQSFESIRSDYMKSLGADDTGKPQASEASVQLAWELTNAAGDCFNERGVGFNRISTYAFEILPGAEAEPARTAALLESMTEGAVVYDVGFFLRKPFAAGGFEGNILFLPHSAVLGKIDMVTRHELNHARAHALWLQDDQRLRHLWIFGDDTMFVDEVLAYADGGINQANAGNMRSWSLDMAHEYIAGTRALLKTPQAEIATEMEGQRCPMSPALKEEVSAMLSCIEGVLDSDNPQTDEISACDGPRPQAQLCSP